ncbi:Na/Pi cotransporter family protein [Ensifer adhaerens]|uniref:Na/Pi cotransporter family protein n=1 Tax=Ensifer adhaerens TaxID=106592 RepID=UPI001CBA8357|nr:Na/Pi cotransporter family protein [Ensifer adhaerens]MBZ7921578.1 Na/Pi cotransporter family protein [Ensifer adhaerens]UAX94002.1 Na/Pi cotransporter family protein [Ensifer adhaerens]UAY01636.1 Na/Pi cotransporter family protein [Ensifer adhaerens]UAY09020.1 Na/Pi cotransporter family protein [Ensifer adhaerens]
MQSTIVMVNLFGAVALLLFGLSLVKDGVTRAFGARLRAALAQGTNGGVRSFATGLVATLALQSSTATALMTASFVEKGLVRSRMAQIVLLGANVGTALTAWIVATGIEWLSPLVILVGVVLHRASRSNARQGLGAAFVGIGLMLLSLHLLGSATEPMRDSPALAAFLGMLDSAWPVALIISAGLAFASSSSLAVVMLVLSLSSAGILTVGLTVALVLGANLGGAIPPVMATLASAPSARRVTLGNLVIRAIGCLIALPLTSMSVEFLQSLPLPQQNLPVDIHLAFNLAVAILAWPFAGPLSQLMVRFIPDTETEESGPRYLDENALHTPVMALSGATREVLRVGDLVETMLMRAASAFENNDLSDIRDIGKFEKQVDQLQQEVKIFLSRLGRDGLSQEDGRRSIVIIDYAINLEHMGDIIEKGLCEEIAKKVNNGLKFSEEGYQELKSLFNLTIDNLRVAQSIFVSRNADLARQLIEVKVSVRHMEKRSAERHIERLRDGLVQSLQTSSLHLDMLRDLKRVNAHVASVAYPILEESGLLTESRLRPEA